MGKKRKSKFSIKEYSKKILTAMIVLWFLGAFLGFAVVIVQLHRVDMMINLSDLLLYIGAPMTGGIVSYMLKSAFENKEKIKNYRNESEDLP